MHVVVNGVPTAPRKDWKVELAHDSFMSPSLLATTLGSLMTKEEFGLIFAAGTLTYAFSFLVNGPLVDKIGGGNPLAIVSSMIVGGHVVDVSPLSTLGALCLAATADGPTARILFRRLLIWGLSMTVVGALLCQTFAGMVARL